MRNNRFNVAVHDELDCFLKYIHADQANRLIQRGIVEIAQWAGAGDRRRVRVIRIVPPPPPPSDSTFTPTTITLSDMLANVGLPCTYADDCGRGSHENYISPGRIRSAQRKVRAFEVPSWIDRVVETAAPLAAQISLLGVLLLSTWCPDVLAGWNYS